MLERCQNAQERWGGVSDIIDSWLEGRQVLISNFVALPSQKLDTSFNDHLGRFCILLMDYLSSGHFEVYEQLLREGSEFNDGSVEQAQELFPLIQQSTDKALDFNDSYASLNNPTLQEVREFAEQLSSLGESLESRFTLEDKMIEILHLAHCQKQATAS